jgi:hypothetical protein
MRNAIAALAPVFALLLAAAPAKAVSHDVSAAAGSALEARTRAIVLYDRPVPAAALLGRADGALVAQSFGARGHGARERTWSRLRSVWAGRPGGGWHRPTRPDTPRPNGPAIPEPGAALVFAAGLLLVSRSRRQAC